MPRAPRVYIEGALYYITTRGDHNQNIFKNDEDYKTYIELLKKYKEQYGFKLFSFILLPNHLHLLIELKQGITISEIMHDLNSSYTKYFNNRYNKKGHLLQERFRLVLIEKSSYLLYMTAYVHLNPLSLRLVKEIEEYPYNSYHLYIKGRKQAVAAPGKIDLGKEVGEVLSLLSDIFDYPNYKDFLKNIPQEEIDNLSKRLHKGKILGSEGFKQKIKQEIVKSKLKTKSSQLLGNRRFILAGSLAVLALGIVNIILYGANKQMRNKFYSLSKQKEEELNQRLSEEKERIKRGLDELYRANMVSYMAMSRRLEIEKKKVKKLEEKLK